MEALIKKSIVFWSVATVSRCVWLVSITFALAALFWGNFWLLFLFENFPDFVTEFVNNESDYNENNKHDDINYREWFANLENFFFKSSKLCLGGRYRSLCAFIILIIPFIFNKLNGLACFFKSSICFCEICPSTVELAYPSF